MRLTMRKAEIPPHLLAFFRPIGFKQKDEVDTPNMLAEALRQDGWYRRATVVWAKPNPMPESVTDRPTKSHEYVFLLSKAATYYYDAEAVKEPSIEPVRAREKFNGESAVDTKMRGHNCNCGNSGSRNLRSVWAIATQPCKLAHFATMPTKLAETCIKAGTSERGACPKCGAPWERVVERTDVIDPSAKGSRFDLGKTGINGNGRTHPGERYVKQTVGWRPTCPCGGVKPPDDLRNRGEDTKMSFHSRQVGSGQKLQDWYNEHPVQTIGWRPGCACGDTDTRPCVVLDPFSGAGTTGLVALGLGRDYIGIDLKEEYNEMARQRFRDKLGLFYAPENDRESTTPLQPVG